MLKLTEVLNDLAEAAAGSKSFMIEVNTKDQRVFHTSAISIDQLENARRDVEHLMERRDYIAVWNSLKLHVTYIPYENIGSVKIVLM